MKISIKGFITSKKSEPYSDCADNYAVNWKNHKFSISDGVSKSFFPKIWSEILVKNYVSNKVDDFVKESQTVWQSKIDKIIADPQIKWFTKAQYNRKDPALATFVGLEFSENQKKWSAQALGDSFLFFVPKTINDLEIEIIKLSSKPSPIRFDNFPDYFSSIGNSHRGETQEIANQNLVEGTFYLMTDALAEWFLYGVEPKHAIQKINSIKSQEHFVITIEDERNSKRLNDDDSAILIIKIEEDGLEKFTYGEPSINYLFDLIQTQETKAEEENCVILEERQDSLITKNEDVFPLQETLNEDIKIIQKIEEADNTETINDSVQADEKVEFNKNILTVVAEQDQSALDVCLVKEKQTEEIVKNEMPYNISPEAKSVTDKF